VKRWAVYLARVVLCSSLAFAAGCATYSRPGPDSGAAAETASASAFSEALARYSTGLALEWQNDAPGSFSNFLRAAELDPDNEELQFRVALSLIQQRRLPEAVTLMERLAGPPAQIGAGPAVDGPDLSGRGRPEARARHL
jgi:hypothetical protein